MWMGCGILIGMMDGRWMDVVVKGLRAGGRGGICFFLSCSPASSAAAAASEERGFGLLLLMMADSVCVFFVLFSLLDSPDVFDSPTAQSYV